VSIFLYHVFLWFYRTGIRLIAPWNRKARLWIEGRKAQAAEIKGAGEAASSKLQATSQPAEKTPEKGLTDVKPGQTIWMHCSSLGEFEQGRPVLESLRRQYPGCRVVLSFFSPSGYEAKKNYAGADKVYYLPLDSKGNARRFINLVKPTLVIWIKYDYWYYYLVELKKRNIPLLLVSGVFRRDQPFFKWYGRLHRYMLDCFTKIFVQTEDSRKLLAKLGFRDNVVVSGDTRFDRVIEIAEKGEPLPLIESFCGNRPVIVAGSTWEEDEEELDHYANTHPDLRFIVAPHDIEPDRLREVEHLFRHCVRYSVWEREKAASFELRAASQTPVGVEEGDAQGHEGKKGNGKTKRASKKGNGWPEPNVLIIDNIGMLSRLYGYATIAYVGGGFGDDGVHNVLEAAVYGRPVVFGPVIEKYAEAVELTDCGGGVVIDSALEAESVFNRLLSNEEEYRHICSASREYVYSKRGATNQVVDYIQENRLLTN
jgi:3-deoxy-D-manno-octulosonic-acid transferase